MLLEIFVQVVLPVFGVAAVGWYFAGRHPVDERGLAAIVIQLSAPALVFHSLVSRPLETGSLLRVGGGVIFGSLVCGLLGWLLFRQRFEGRRGLYLAAMFPNTGNLGLPLALTAFGVAGQTVAVVVFVAISMVHYGLGTMILAGTRNPLPALRSPLVLGALLGLGVASSGLELPKPVLRFTEILGSAAVPVMLLGLGVRLRSVRLGTLGRPLLAVALRMLPGFGAALLWTSVFELQGVERSVVLLTGVLPPAVMNYALAEAHDQGAEDVAAAILLGTLIAIGTIPAVIWLGGGMTG
jgi:predicted permease